MNRGSSAGLAGWVFADALLALTIIGLAAGGSVSSGSPGAPSAVAATTAPAPAPAPVPAAPAPAPAPASVPEGIAQAPVVLELSVDARDDEAVRSTVAAAVRDLEAQGRRAAFVLTFGTAATPGAGTALARRVNDQLDDVSPAVFAGSAKRDFWRAVNAGSPRPGVVRLEVYLRQP